MSRANEVATRIVAKLFEKNPLGVEKHLSREMITSITMAAYEIGYQDGGLLPEHVFTFGTAHVHPDTGASLGTRYVVVRAAAPEEARAIMELYFGKKWSHQYTSRADAETQKHELRELVPTDWPKIPGGRA